MNYGDRLKNLRENKKLSQQQLADKLKINRSTYARYELNQTQPDIETLKMIADFYEVTTDYIVGRTNYMQESNKNVSVNESHGTYNSLDEISKLIKQFGIEDIGFFDIEKWKNLKPEDVEEIRKHFEWVAYKAKERNKEK